MTDHHSSGIRGGSQVDSSDALESHAWDSPIAEHRPHDSEAHESLLQLDQWMQDLQKCAHATYSSPRWKIPAIAKRLFDRMLLRTRQPDIDWYVENVLSQYQKWRLAAVQNDLVPAELTHQSVKRDSKIGLAGKLLAFAVAHPVRTCQQINRDNLIVFFDLFFRSSATRTNTAVDNFLETHGGQTSQFLYPHQRNLPQSLRFSETTEPLVSIIVPVFNHFESTFACLAHVQKNTLGIPYELILADDASTDDLKTLSGRTQGMRVIQSSQNLGFLGNCNRAAAQARGDYLLFLNNDAYVQPGWLKSLLEVIQNDPTVGIVGPKFLSLDGLISEAGGIVWNDGSAWNYGRNAAADRPEYNYRKEVDFMSGACLLIRKTLWESLGGFDQRFAPAYYEDVDIAFSARQQGFRVVYQPEAEVYHAEGESSGTDLHSGVKQNQVKNQQVFFQKWQSILPSEQAPPGEQLFSARDRSRRKKQMLVIDHYLPRFDKDTGSRATLQYVSLFAEQGLNVKFLGDNFHPEKPYLDVLQQMGIETLVGSWYATNWRRWLRQHKQDFDYVFLLRPSIAIKYLEILTPAPRPKLLFQGVDLHFLRVDRQAKCQADPKLVEEARKWEQLELQVCEAVDVAYYYSAVEISELSARSTNICGRQLPLYLMDGIEPTTTPFDQRKDLLFVGGFQHEPNSDGLKWFVQDVLPLVLAQQHDVKLYVIGSHVTDEVLALASNQVVIVGEVSDDELRRRYKECRLSIVPLRFGAGIKGKILESNCLQVPVVTTEIGAEGLPEPRDYLRVADTPEAFARAVLDVYTDPQEWNRLAVTGRNMIQQHFSKQAALEILRQDVEFH